ncbi:hypothetical protein [Actinoallomurus sp. CA-150999]|uniref:hypothetical protein n=1 Tax=Actinoallomurus sp. CA-150999 TaxID=3239887 RepID=UPI003D8A002B
MPVLLDDPIDIETTPDGRPAAITWRGERYAVRVLQTWEGRVHKIAATLSDGPAIGEIAQDPDGQRGRLRRWWTA